MKVTRLLKAAAVISTAALVISCSGITAESESDDSAERAATTTVTTESALRTAINNATAGSSIKLGANITLTSQLQLLNSGTSSSKINFSGNGYTIDCSGISSGWGIKVNGSYWNITNMTVANAPDCGMVLQLGGNNYIGYCRFKYNGDSGLQIYNSSHDNYVYKCESYYNYDSDDDGEDADGFACKLSGGKNNVFDGCIAKYNSDDGWDLYSQPYTVTFRNCEASWNGYRDSSLTTTSNGDGNGFKLGSKYANVSHSLTDCVANYNLASGYDGNGNTASMSITNCTASNNKKYQFYRITGISNQ